MPLDAPLVTISNIPEGLAAYRFLRAAKEQVEIVLCLELVKDCSIGTAPRFHKASWSSGPDLEDKFQRVPQALLTVVRLDDLSWCKRTSRHELCLRILLYSEPSGDVAMKLEMFLRMPPPFSTMAGDLCLSKATKKARAPFIEQISA